MKSDKHQSLRGFSLIELLVVMAIVALLIAALMPALQKSRMETMRVQCMSNLRQQSVAVGAYAGDNAGRFPATIRFGSTWMINLRHYMGYTDRASVPYITYAQGHAHSIDRLVPTFRCPQTTNWRATTQYSGSYGINLLMVSPRQSSGILANNLPYGRTLDNLRNSPSRIYLISDAPYYSSEGWHHLTYAVTPELIPGWLGRHHNLKANILFVDGHIEALGKGDNVMMYYRDEPSRIPDGWTGVGYH